MTGAGAPPDAPPRRPRGRPRSEHCRCAILDAAAAQLEGEGYAALTIEGVAERAGVAKQTIYKWWPSKPRLAMEAYARRVAESIERPDTGTLEGDLRSLLRATCRFLSRSDAGPTLAGLIAAAQCDPDFAAVFRDVFIGARRANAAGLFARAAGRGELGPGVDVPLALDLLFGPLWYRLLLRNAPLDGAFADAVVDRLLAGLRAGA